MDLTNQGYQNSGVMINAVLHCSEEYQGVATADSSATLDNFRLHKVHVFLIF